MKANGKVNKVKETARKLLDRGMDVREIAEITGLSEEEVKTFSPGLFGDRAC